MWVAVQRRDACCDRTQFGLLGLCWLHELDRVGRLFIRVIFARRRREAQQQSLAPVFGKVPRAREDRPFAFAVPLADDQNLADE
jgi:hypothetical protein